VRVNDPSVGTSIEFLPASNTLRIPQLTLGGAQFHNVSLTAPVAAIVSYGPVIIDPGIGGGSTLVVAALHALLALAEARQKQTMAQG
jgi:hypothetical protein